MQRGQKIVVREMKRANGARVQGLEGVTAAIAAAQRALRRRRKR